MRTSSIKRWAAVVAVAASAVMAAGSDSNAIIQIPISLTGTNPYTWDNAHWWTNNPTPQYIETWQAWWAARENFRRLTNSLAGISNILAGLDDAHTNALLNSPRVVYWQTNSMTVAASTTNALFWLTNYAGATFDRAAGRPEVALSFDGTNWSTSGSRTLVTNTPVRVGLIAQLVTVTSNGIPVQVPMDGTVSNLVIFRMSRPDLFERTNDLTGQRLMVDEPRAAREAVSKGYVDDLFTQTAWWSAENDVQLNGNGMHLNGDWELVAEEPDTNSSWASFRWLGARLLSIEAVAPSYGNINDIWTDGGTNVFVMVSSNGVTTAPALQFTHLLDPLNWEWLTEIVSSYPTVTNHIHTWHHWDEYGNPLPDTYTTNYGFQVSFVMPTADQGYVRVGFASPNPAMLQFGGMRVSGFGTVTNSNSTTWGYGAGLVRVDTNYLYVSVGTNAWKRAALSGW